jgi:hypothetical protein
MKAEGEMGYEPSLLVLMSRHMDVSSNKVWRTASILKDRSTRIDGKEFTNPTFKSFLPHIEYLNLGGQQLGVDTSRTSENEIPPDAPRDRNAIRRDICLEEIQALMVKHYPTTNAEDKKAKAALLVKYFATTSWTEVEKLMPLVDLQANYNNMHCDLEGKPSRYGVKVAAPTEPIDEIPHLEPAKGGATPAPEPGESANKSTSEPAIAAEPDDRDIIVRDFEIAIARETDPAKRKALWDGIAEAREIMTEEQNAKIRIAYGKAIMSPNGKPARGKASAKQEAA